jgi:hypothetical protein
MAMAIAMAIIMIVGIIITIFFVLAAAFVLPAVFLLLFPLFLRRRVFSPSLHLPDSVAASGCAGFPNILPGTTPAFIVLNSFFSTLFFSPHPRLSKTGVTPAVLPVKGLR